jgi:hypothetical protein
LYTNGSFSYRTKTEETQQKQKTFFGTKNVTIKHTYYEVIINNTNSKLTLFLPFNNDVLNILSIFNYEGKDLNVFDHSEEDELKAYIRSTYPDRDEY